MRFDDVDDYGNLGLGEKPLALQIAWNDCPELKKTGPTEKVLELSEDALAMLEQNSSFIYSLSRAARAIKFLRPHLDIQPIEETPDD